MTDPTPSKRVKHTSCTTNDDAFSSAGLLVSEPALLERILLFLPSASATNDASSVLEIVKTLCHTVPGLDKRVGPTNEAFWRAMVLGHFDFTTDESKSFNVTDYCGDGADFWGSQEDDEADEDDEYADWHRHPLNGPMDEWEQEREQRGGELTFLVERLGYWQGLGAYFKPMTYSFLEAIQRDTSLLGSRWPEDEDAFSLFCDLLLLPHFQSNDVVTWKPTQSEDEEATMTPCFLGRMPTKVLGHGYALLKFCGYAPYYWADDAVSRRWRGFDGPAPTVVCTRNASTTAVSVNETEEPHEETRMENDEQDDDHEACERRLSGEWSLFPEQSSYATHPFSQLRRFVHTTFSDWRSLRFYCEGDPVPEFCIGSTKRSGRWMGFVGECWAPRVRGP